MGKNIAEDISKNLRGKYSHKFFDHAKQTTTDAFKTASKQAIQEAAEATGNSTGNKIADRIMKVSKTSQQDNSETVTNEYDKEIPKERYISPEERQKVIDHLRLI